MPKCKNLNKKTKQKKCSHENQKALISEAVRSELNTLFQKGSRYLRKACVEIKKISEEKELSPKQVIELEFSSIISMASYYRQIAGYEADTVLNKKIGFVPTELAALITPKKVPAKDVQKVWKKACSGKELPTKEQLIDAIKTYQNREIFKGMITDKKTLIEYFKAKNTPKVNTITQLMKAASKEAHQEARNLRSNSKKSKKK